MKTIFRIVATSLAMLLILMLTGCVGLSEEMGQIDNQIRESIEKTFPLPDQVVIKTHVGDDLRFATKLSVDEVATFYKNAYDQRGYVLDPDSQLLTEPAVLLFHKDGEKNVRLEVAKDEEGSDVHIQLK